jgi:hypothetical protein
MKLYKKNALLILCVIVLTALSCNFATAVTPPPATTEQILPVTGDTATVEAGPVPTDTPAPTATTSSSVTITVLHDSLSIRRGPTIYYDVLDYFKANETATASARNSDGSWLYIAFPNNPSAHGWVSALTDYSSTQGDVNSLPVMNVDPPMPAYIRNCTYHPMLIKPANLTLKDQLDMGGRIHQFAPGNYSAWDQSETGPNPVFSVALTEGDSVDINVDGFGNMYYCP